MKVVHLVWDFATGGIETMLSDIIEEQVKMLDVTLVVLNNHIVDSLITQIPKECHLFLINRPRGSKNPLYLFKLNLVLCKIKPDIIHLHHGNIIKFVLPCWRTVCTIHTTNFDPRQYKSSKIRYFAISKSVEDKAHKNQLPNIKLINNGVPIERIKTKELKTTNIRKIIQVGRFTFPHKGQDLLIHASNELYNKRQFKNFEVHFIGYGPDEVKMKEMIKEFGLSRNVFIVGHKSRKEVLESLCDFDLFVQPSRFEGFGLTLAEAMAAKLPVLSSDVEGPLEIIDKANCGILFQSNNVGDLAEKIASIITNGYSGDMVERAYERVCTLYNVKMTAKEYVNEYLDICQKES